MNRDAEKGISECPSRLQSSGDKTATAELNLSARSAKGARKNEIGFAAMRLTPINPVHALFIAGCLPLFLGALLSDWAYASTYFVQWTNFASWLLAGALILSGAALIWSLVDIFRVDRPRDRTRTLLLIFLAGVFILGFVNALVHARDAWAIMPLAIILSTLVFLLTCASAWIGFATLRAGEKR